MRKEVIRKPVLPYYLAGAGWLIYSLLLPFYRVTDILVAAVLSAAIFFVAAKVIPGRTEWVEAKEDPVDSGNRRVDEMVAAGKGLLREIRAVNDRIAQPALTARVDSLEEVSRQIFSEVIRRPRKAPEIRRFLEYYLPVTLKLLKSYDNMSGSVGGRGVGDGAGQAGQASQAGQAGPVGNVRVTMAKIENVMETITQAFRAQLDRLFQDEALDISTDITVLRGLLTQEGLLADGLTVERYAQGETGAGPGSPTGQGPDGAVGLGEAGGPDGSGGLDGNLDKGADITLRF
ncbi:MAG: 5-bromo-4-chloroindolyl phosphate hydrolysis family protein [Peptococcaceae bacterium]|jgi:hypothetical protein|nr:5-bromo-4-chloroindolyl phosphate hydrolysis family protein [Peptococcaceae bacterium]